MRQNNMKVIGITGGIGSGKSTVMNILEEKYGVKVILADAIGHKAMEKEAVTYKQMIEAFGEEILNESGEIDRLVLAPMLLSSPVLLEKQNSIVHPFVNNEIEKQLAWWREEGIALAAVESAILVEAGCSKMCDEIWFVTADKDIRIERLMKNRGYSKEKAESFIKRQKSDADYRKDCHAVIYNNGNMDEVTLALEKLMEKLLK